MADPALAPPDQDRLLVASGDGHVGPPMATYRDHLESEHHAAFDDFLRTHRNRWTPGHADSVLTDDAFAWIRDHDRYRSGGLESLSDPTRRLKEMDEDGIAVEVLFPDDQNGNTPPWLVGLAPIGLDHAYPRDLRVAGARAYNRWLAGFCAVDPDRLVGAALLGSLHDVDAAVTELHRAHASGLRHAVMLPLDYYLPLYHHPRYEPLWEACVELDVSVAVHLADGGPDWYGDDPWDASIYVMESFFFAHRPLWCLVLGGVLERHPALRVVFTEQQALWVAETVPMMDGVAGGVMRAAQTAPLPLRPSEYFHRQCFVANSLMHRRDIDARGAIGTDVLMWGSDSPHQEGSWPEVGAKLRELFSGVPLADATAILGDNFLRAYPLDAAKLQTLASTIGPRPADLGIAA
jgi:predicted TIM-barrel fold metal-dependent hydrolase